MKNLICLLFLTVGLIACGKEPVKPEVPGPCSGAPYKGSWVNKKNQGILKFNDDCSFEESFCKMKGTYQTIQGGGIVIQATEGGSTTENNEEGCLPRVAQIFYYTPDLLEKDTLQFSNIEFNFEFERARQE